MVVARCGECGDIFNVEHGDVFETDLPDGGKRLVAFCKPCQKAARQAC